MSEITTPRPVALNTFFTFINLFGLGYLFYYPRPLFATDGGFYLLRRASAEEFNLSFLMLLGILFHRNKYLTEDYSR
jgi:hypothetical protein